MHSAHNGETREFKSHSSHQEYSINKQEKQKEHARKHYLANKEKIKTRAREWTNAQVIKNKTLIREHLLLHPCIDCGEDDIRVLEFDHIKDKELDISIAIQRGWSSKKLQKEIDKCEVRCANCHRIKTFEENKWTK